MRKTVSPASPPPPAASPGPAILIVDDEVQALQSFAIALRSAGIEPVVCEQDSRRALERLAEGDFGAILLDLMMPFFPGANSSRAFWPSARRPP
jgi:DNA-binding response OmpR family regulator